MTEASFGLNSFNLRQTLAGGQAFRWKVSEVGPFAQGVVQGNLWEANWSGGFLTIRCLSAGTLREPVAAFAGRYFDLGRDYQQIETKLLRHKVLRPGFFRCAGLRLLRQDWFEVIVSFILSANNNIPRIARSVESISTRYGTPFHSQAGQCFAFPTPAQLAGATCSDLRQLCNTGYRDTFVLQTAQHIARDLDFWQEAADLKTEKLRTVLHQLPGVGPKVAECILLFGFGRWEAFPVDTWVRKSLHQHFSLAPNLSDQQLHVFATKRFGKLAGFAQQILFESIRPVKK